MSVRISEDRIDIEELELKVELDDALDAHAHIERAERSLAGLRREGRDEQPELLRALALVRTVLADILGI